MKATPQIYIDNPVILDITTVGIEKLSNDEIFVELPFSDDYAISNYARLYSKKRHRILKPQRYGTASKKNDYHVYRLRGKDGNIKNLRANRLVAEIFCENNYPATKKEVHHLDGRLDDNYKNLRWVSRSEHRLLEKNKLLYLYNNKTKKLKRFESLQSLCSYANIDRNNIHYSLYIKEPCYSLNNKLSVHKLVVKTDDKDSLFAVYIKTPTKKECLEITQSLVLCGILLLAGLQLYKKRSKSLVRTGGAA